MSELQQWQKDYIEEITAMSNSELLDSVLDQADGDSWDGYFTEKGFWKYSAAKTHLRMRLVDWLNEGEK